MAVENITLNLIPTGDTPSIHAAQYDIDRTFTVTLKEGEDDFTPTGYDIELQVRKVDNNIVTAIPTSTSGNVVTFNTTEQMTACSGTNLAELQLSKDSQTFATLHFYLVVQRDVLAGGVTSESDIYNLTEQITAIVPEVIGDDYYNKEEVDEKIAEIPTFDPTNYYDKSDVDTLLNNKADISDLPDMSNYYDKSETDALLDDKANVSDLPDMSNYYNKTEVDNKITELYQIKIVSGSIVHFTDGGNDIPVKSLVSEIVAVESGNGQPKSPDNPYTISGFDNGVVPVCGVNVWNETTKNGYWNTTNGNYVSVAGQLCSNDYISVKENTAYYFYKGSTTNQSEVLFYDKSKTFISYLNYSQCVNKAFITPSNCAYITFNLGSNYGATYLDNISFNYPSSDTQYHAYNGNTYTFTFGQTVYGGHFDNKGNLENNRGELVLSSLNWYYSSNGYFEASINIDCPRVTQWVTQKGNCGVYSIVPMYFITNSAERINNSIAWYPNVIRVADNSTTDVSTFVTKLQNQSVYYELATPIPLAITSQDIPTLSGENNISSNTGDIEVEYFTEKSDGIAELIKAFM